MSPSRDEPTGTLAAAFAGATPRTLADKAADVVSVRDAGLRGDDGSDSRELLAALIERRPRGTALFFPSGRYFLAGGLDVVLDSPLELRLDAGAVLVGDNTPTSMLLLRGGAGRQRVAVIGGQVDNGDRAYVAAKTSGTALHLIDIDEFLVLGVTFGRRDRHWRDGFGDSGITATRVARGTISGCRFFGQPDLGIYLSGGATGAADDDGGDVAIVGNHFAGCRGGCAVKRQAARTVFANNTLRDCADGFLAWDSGAGRDHVPPGRTGVVAGNVFEKMGRRAIELRGDGWAVTGNVIEDIGHDENGAPASGLGISLLGARACLVSGNLVRSVDWADHDKLRAIRVNAYTDPDGRVTVGGAHHIAGNAVHDIHVGFSEGSGDPSHWPGNTLLRVAVPAQGLGAGSEGAYWDGEQTLAFVDGQPLPESGTYAPALRVVAGLGGGHAGSCLWSRRGRIVTIAGTLELRQVAATAALQIELPIARAFAAGATLAGFALPVGALAGSGRFTAVLGDAAVQLQLSTASSAASATWQFTLTYSLPAPTARRAAAE